jgi:hypothetical protein
VTVDGTRIRGGSARDRHMFELGVHGSMMRFDTIFDFDDSPGFGAHIGIRLLGFMLEAEGDVTTVDDVVVFSDRQESETVAGKVFTLFGNARLDLGTGALVPFVKAGYGKVLFRDFLTDDDANAYQAGAGASLWLGPAFGVRAQFRAMRFEDVFGAGGNTMNYRVTAGAVLRF